MRHCSIYQVVWTSKITEFCRRKILMRFKTQVYTSIEVGIWYVIPKHRIFGPIFYEGTIKPAIHLSSNWREREKMLAKWEKQKVYRWHFVNHLANHFSHLTFRRSRQAIGVFTKCQRERYSKFLVESKMNKIVDIVRSVEWLVRSLTK